jgi:purine nucleosidase
MLTDLTPSTTCARPVIIDCDPGVDDAIALLLALACPEELSVLAVTTVAGNVPLNLTQNNARRICELAGKLDMPVYAGCPRPLLRSLITAADVHGNTGLDGTSLPEPQLQLQSSHAVAFLIDTLMHASEPLTLAILGPLTNLAVALIQQPEIASQIREVVIMGGAVTQGNITPSSEFNFYVDPHAAQVVFTAGLPLTLITLDVTHQAIATPDRISALRAIQSAVSDTVVGLLEHYAKYDMSHYNTAGPFLHDPCVIAYLLRPDLFTCRPVYIEVETSSPLTMGRTVVDLWQSMGRSPNANLVDSINVAGFYELLIQSLAKL